MGKTVKDLPSPEVMRQFLAYDPETGKFSWKIRSSEWFADARSCAWWNTMFSGKPALTAKTRKYHIGRVLDINVLAHRAAWAIYNGEWPAEFIDHINGDGFDNRICNLRAATKSENQKNRKPQADHSSQYLGVQFESGRSKFRARIRVDGKQKSLGSFQCEEAAARAYDQAARLHHGEFARPNFEVSHG